MQPDVQFRHQYVLAVNKQRVKINRSVVAFTCAFRKEVKEEDVFPVMVREANFRFLFVFGMEPGRSHLCIILSCILIGS